MDLPLRDALRGGGGGAAEGFWQRAFTRVRSARRDGKGRVRTRTLKPAGGRRISRPKRRRSATAARPPKTAARRRSAAIRPRGKTPRRRPAGRSADAHTARASGTRGARASFESRGRIAGGESIPGGGTGLHIRSIYVKRKAARKKTAKKKKKPFKPPTLSQWLGKGALRPPTGKMEPPSFSGLKKKFPPALPDGKAYSRKTPGPKHLEKIIPPGEHPKYQRWLELDADRGRGDEPHWHGDGKSTGFYHFGDTWARSDHGRWAWMIKHKRKWWTIADGAQRMVRHQEHWWWKTGGGWFLLHSGEPWAWRHFADWKRDGLLHPGSETRIVYSADGRRVAVSTPGKGTRVFDAKTGKLLAEFPEK